MEIDIINFTQEQYATLTPGQLSKVRVAQSQKNDLTWNLRADLTRVKNKLIDRRTFNSETYDKIAAVLQEKYDQQVEVIRDGLLFYLHYSMRPDNTGTTVVAPYEVNYALDSIERFKIVREYYETTYTDGVERFSAFKADTIAPSYLEEMYAPLYDYLLALSK